MGGFASGGTCVRLLSVLVLFVGSGGCMRLSSTEGGNIVPGDGGEACGPMSPVRGPDARVVQWYCWEDTVGEVEAVPDPGFVFVGWEGVEGACGPDPVCRTDVVPWSNLRATFAAADRPSSPEKVFLDNRGVLHFFAVGDARVHRYWVAEERWLAPLPLPAGVLDVTLAPGLERLYLSHEARTFTYLDLADGRREKPFAEHDRLVQGMAMAGDFLFAVLRGDRPYGHSLFAPDGTMVDQRQFFTSQAVEFSWSEALRRLLWVRSDAFDELESHEYAADGSYVAFRRAPSFPSYELTGPVRVSPDGLLAAVASGEVHDAETMAVVDYLPEPFVDAAWFGGDLLTLTSDGAGGSRLARHEAGRSIALAELEGEPFRVFEWEGRAFAVTLVEGSPSFRWVEPGDVDADGAADAEDAFPLDAAAFEDSDGDGAPDAWDPAANPGSTLVVDAFPSDTACQLPEHGLPAQPGVCDVAARLPAFVPLDTVIDADGVVYLLAPEDDRIFRWSLPQQVWLDPIATGPAPRGMAYDAVGNRLQIVYRRRPATVIPLDETPLRETPFTPTLDEPRSAIALDGLLLVPLSEGDTWHRLRTFSEAGAVVGDGRDTNTGRVRDYVWDPILRRVYAASGDSFDSWNWTQIAASGEITAIRTHSGERDVTTGPLAPSPDGRHLRFGTGLLYRVDGDRPFFVTQIPGPHVDHLWLPDGGWVALGDDGAGGTHLSQYGPEGVLYGEAFFPGAPHALLRSEGALAVVTLVDGRPAIETYVPDDDADGDGVPFAEDAFPDDVAASLDTDGDGFPDAWNPGYGVADSTTGLELDAFPLDAACQRPEDSLPGQSGQCDLAPGPFSFRIGATGLDAHGVLHVLDTTRHRILRWTFADGALRNPVWLGEGALNMVYSASHDALYVAYEDGRITRVAPDGLAGEAPFAAVPGPVPGLVAAGDFLVASSTVDDQFYVYDAAGNLVENFRASHDSQYLTWSEANGRFYHLSDGWSSNRLRAQNLDPGTGAWLGSVPAQGLANSRVRHPIRVSQDGGRVSVRTGEIYDGHTLDPVARLPIEGIYDAVWLEDGSLVTIRGIPRGTALERWDADLRRIDAADFDGSALGVWLWQGGVRVVTGIGTLAFHDYALGDDGDGDSVSFAEDAFPLSAAASVDSDDDGYPDFHHLGYGFHNSGLARDAFPFDSACHAPSHARAGAPDECDVEGRVPFYDPDEIVMDSRGVIHLLDGGARRIHGYAFGTGALNPIVTDDVVTQLIYSADHDRLYVGGDGGGVSWIDPLEPVEEERLVVSLGRVFELDAWGPWLRVNLSNTTPNRLTYDRDGNELSGPDRFVGGTAAVWSPATGRLHAVGATHRWEEVDPTTGQVLAQFPATGAGEPGAPPVWVPDDGSVVLDGSGRLYEASAYIFLGELGFDPEDAAFLEDGFGVLLADGDGGTLLERYDLGLRLLERVAFPGEPRRVFAFEGGFQVVTHRDGRPDFHRHVPTDDADADGVPDGLDAFPRDPAASIDVDADGAPDYWNPGSGPADSTTGLVLDAFPEDFGCQRPEHGLEGACDVARVLPPTVATPLCDFQTDPTAPTGTLDLGDIADFEALCSGWVLSGERMPDEIVLRNVFSDRIGAVFPLTSAPEDLLLDAEAHRLWVTLPEEQEVLALDLTDGSTVRWATPSYTGRLELGPEGSLLMARPNRHGTTLHWLEAGATEFDAGYIATGGPLQYNALHGELLRATHDLSRFAFDLEAGPVFLESLRNGAEATGLALSPDGEHVVWLAPSSRILYDRVSNDLESVHGTWAVDVGGQDAVFSPDGMRLVYVTRDELLILDAEIYEERQRFEPDYCSSGQIDRARVSSDGTVAFAGERCGYPREFSRIHWLAID